MQESENHRTGVLAMSDLTIRQLNETETEHALRLVWEVFLDYEAPDYTQAGVDAFYRSIHDARYRAMLCVYGAFLHETLVGVLATRSGGTHIALFFVKGAYHRQRIGRRLFETALIACGAGRMTVNSSPYAVPVYHKLGFRDTGAEQVTDGLRFTPMERPAD